MTTENGVCLWENRRRYVPVGEQKTVCACWRTEDGVCLWDNRKRCVPVGEQKMVCACGRTEDGACLWENRRQCVPVGEQKTVRACGRTDDSVHARQQKTALVRRTKETICAWRTRHNGVRMHDNTKRSVTV